MAKKAKEKSKQLSYAEMAKKAEGELTFFARTVCTLKPPPNAPNKRIPNTNEKYSFFVDLTSTDATEEEVANCMPANGIQGVKYRPDLRVVEFVCANEETAKVGAQKLYQPEGKKAFSGIYPRHKVNKMLLVKLANVPFGAEATLAEQLKGLWNQYGEVVDIAPHKVPGKPWITQRWDLLLKLQDNEKKLNAPVVFELEGHNQKILATWAGARKSCLRCLTEGHSTSRCPSVKSSPEILKKVGGLANPLQKIGEDTQSKKGKGRADLPPATTAPSATIATAATNTATVASTSATQATSATVAVPSATFNFVLPAGLESGDLSHASSAAPTGLIAVPMEGVVNRSSTPPSVLTVEDPDTPRRADNKKKRMAKNIKPFRVTEEDVDFKMAELNLCGICWRTGHLWGDCTDRKEGEVLSSRDIAAHPQFLLVARQWQRETEKRNKMETTAVIARVEVVRHCSKCENDKHYTDECPYE